jgi:hypothetical protein
MNKLGLKYQEGNLLTLFLFLTSQFVFAQSPTIFHKFPITQEGVYKITQSHAQTLGIGNLDEIGIYGYPGMLPQKLDSIDLELHSLPAQIVGESLYFFLEGPNRLVVQDDEVVYQHHLYSDTLYYLIGKTNSPSRINILEEEVPLSESGDLTSFQVLKWEETNLLSSGRNWYSDPIFRGRSKSFTLPKPEGSASELDLIVKLMAQSLSENTFEIMANGKSIKTSTIPSITNSTYGIKGREELIQVQFSEGTNTKIKIDLNYRTGDFNGSGYIDYAVMASKFNSQLLPQGIFYNQNDLETTVSVSGNRKLWDITNPFQIKEYRGNHSVKNGEKIILFEPSMAPNIRNLHQVDLTARNTSITSPLIIITSKELVSQANRLASHKNGRGVGTEVVMLEDIYNSFGYGTRDVVAIRNFLAFHFLKYKQLKNVLLFGKGTFDYKDKLLGRPNLIPTYSSRNSLNPLTTYSSDDFYGFLNPGQGEWLETASGDEVLQIGVGRIPAVNQREAAEVVNKIIAYENGNLTGGDWKRKIAFFADDSDNNIHLNDAESHASFLDKNHPEFQIQKLYLDRFEQTKTSTGQFSAEAKEALSKTVEEGILILNYIGHGNATTLTAERVFQTSDLENWPENNLLPLMVTATCEFGRHDSPLNRSGAEEMLFVENKGAIGMLTTGRPVFSSINFALNKAFIENVFNQENGEYLDLGTIFKRTKNNSLNGPFNRNFSLLGDPSLKLAIPGLKTEIDEISDIDLQVSVDTLKATQVIQLTGKIIDPISKSHITSANGEFELILTDKPIQVKTKGDESNPADFEEENGFLFKGKGDVKEGVFTSEIFIPQNIDHEYGAGKIRVFARFGVDNQEAMGAQNIIVGGISENPNLDKVGPNIKLFLGDSTENKTIFSSTRIPVLVYFEDESGINVSSKNSNQDIEISINEGSPLILNNFFQALEGNYRRGKVETLLAGFEEGENSITLKVWDNVGNSSTITKEIIIKGSIEIQVTEHLTYPNPTSEKSVFLISHNRPQENILAILRVYSSMGNEIFRSQKHKTHLLLQVRIPIEG